MASFTEIYASLIENPDIQPPEGQDRDAYVVDLAKQRLRQFKNNEKALSLGIQKSAVENFADFVLTKSEQTRRLFAELMASEHVNPTKIQELIDKYHTDNPEAELKEINTWNGLERLEDTHPVYVALRRFQTGLERGNIKPEVDSDGKEVGGHKIVPKTWHLGGKVVDGILEPNHPMGRRQYKVDHLNQNENLKQQVLSASVTDADGNPVKDDRPLTEKEKELFAEYGIVENIDDGEKDEDLKRADANAQLLDEYGDIYEDMIENNKQVDNAKKNAARPSEGRNENSFGDKEIDEKVKSNRERVDQIQRQLREEKQEASAVAERKEDADKIWDKFQGDMQKTLKKYFGRRKDFDNVKWKELSMTDPRIVHMINILEEDSTDGKKAQKATVMAIHDAMRSMPDLSDSLGDSEHPFHQFFAQEEDSPVSKFYAHNANLTALTHISDGVRRAVLKHFDGDAENISPESVQKLSDKDLTDIWTEAETYLNESAAKDISSEDVREKKLSLIEDIFPSRIPLNTFKENYNKYQEEQQKQALAKVDEGGDVAEAELQKWYEDDALQHLRDNYDLDDTSLLNLAHKANSKGKYGPEGSNRLANRQIRLRLVQGKEFMKVFDAFLTGDENPARMETAMRNGRILNPKQKTQTDVPFGKKADDHETFNSWRHNASEQFIKDAKIASTSADKGRDVEEYFWEQVSEKTGLPVSLVRTGSNERYKTEDDKDGEPTLTPEMKESIFNAMRSVYQKEMVDRNAAFAEIPEDAVPIENYDDLKPLDVSKQDIDTALRVHYAQEMKVADETDQSLQERFKKLAGGTLEQQEQATRLLNRLQAKLVAPDTKQGREDIAKEAQKFNISADVNADYSGGLEEALKAIKISDDDKPQSGVDQVGADVESERSAVDQLSDEANKRVEEDQADDGIKGGDEEKSDGPAAIQWKGGDNYGTSLPNDQFVRDANGDLYVVRRKKGFELELDGIDEEGNSRSSGNRTVNVDPSSAEYDKENEYFRHEIDGQSTRYNLFRVNSGKEPLQINEEDMGKNEQGDPLPNIPDRVRQYLKEAGKSDEEIKALFDTGELHDWEGNPIQLQTIKEQFPMKQQEGGEGKPPSDDKVPNEDLQQFDVDEGGDEQEASGMESIKNIITESDDIEASVKEKVRNAKNIKEINTAVSRVETPVNIESIPSLPLSPAALTEAMRIGLFDLEGNPTPRGDNFLNMVGEAMPDIQEMVNTDDFRDAYKEKYNKTRFNPIRSLSKAALSHIVHQWDSLEGQADEDKIHFSKKDTTKWDQETTTVTKVNGDPVDDNFYTKEFTFGDDAPHLKKAMWGNEESDHNVFSRMLMAGIVAGRLGNDASNHWDELMKEGSIFKGMISQVNGDDISNQDSINNDDLNTDLVVNDIEDFAGGIPAGEDSENFIGDFGIGQDPTPPTPPSDEGKQSDMFGGQDLASDPETPSAGSGAGTPPTSPKTPSTAEKDDDKEDDDKEGDGEEGDEETTSKKEDQINRMMKEQFGDDWKDKQADNDDIDSYHEHLSDMDDTKFGTAYEKYHDRAMNKRLQGTDKPSTDKKLINREKYYEKLADHKDMTVEEARETFGDTDMYDEADFKKLVQNIVFKPKITPAEIEELDRDGMLDKLANLQNESRESVEEQYEHHSDKQLHQSLTNQINQNVNRKANQAESERQQREKITSREANHALTHQFRTPEEFKLEGGGKGEDGDMSMDQAADMFRAVAHHAFPNKHHLDEKGTERLSELFSGLVRHLQSDPAGVEHLDTIYNEVEMARDHGITYGSQEWFDHIDDLERKEHVDAEQEELEHAEDKRKADHFETAIERAFNHPHSGDHSNRAHSFDLEIDTDEDGKHSVKSVEHKKGLHHEVDEEGNAVESEHDHTSHRGEGRSEHAPYDPDHSDEEHEAYQKIHEHKQRMQDLNNPIRRAERERNRSLKQVDKEYLSRQDKQKLERSREKFEHLKQRQERSQKAHDKHQEERAKISAERDQNLEDITQSEADQMDLLREQNQTEFRDLKRNHTRAELQSKNKVNNSQRKLTNQADIHNKELRGLDSTHEQERSDFDSGSGKWDLDELQQTNPEAAARYADPEQRETVKQELYDSHASARGDMEARHADTLDELNNAHVENTSAQDELDKTHKQEVSKLRLKAVGRLSDMTLNTRQSKKAITDDAEKKHAANASNLDTANKSTANEFDKAADAIDRKYDELDKYEGFSYKRNKKLVTDEHDQKIQDMLLDEDYQKEHGEANANAARLENEYLDMAGDDVNKRERMERNLSHGDLGATEADHTENAQLEAEIVEGQAAEQAQGMMNEDTPAPGTPSPNNPNLVYKPGPGKNWVTRDSYNAAVAHGLLAQQNNSVAFTNQGGQITAHHGTDSWHVSPHEAEEGQMNGARSSQEVIGQAIHQGASDWTDEEGTSFADKAQGLKEGESFSIPHDQFKGGTNSSLITGMTGRAKETTDPSSTDDPPKSAATRFLGGMGRKVFQPALQAIKEEGAKAGQGLADTLREGRWAQTNMTASGEGSDKRYKKGFMQSYDPDKSHVGQASLSREMSRFNPFKSQATQAKLSTENQVENRSRQVQALQTHIQSQNTTLSQMSGTPTPTVKPVASPSTKALQEHVQNKAQTTSQPPAPTT